LLKLLCARVFQSIHFFSFLMGCSLWPVMRIRRLLCWNFTSFHWEVCLFVFSVWICLRFMVFFGSREGKRRKCGYLAAMQL
jgi:hypothetical protein